MLKSLLPALLLPMLFTGCQQQDSATPSPDASAPHAAALRTSSAPRSLLAEDGEEFPLHIALATNTLSADKVFLMLYNPNGNQGPIVAYQPDPSRPGHAMAVTVAANQPMPTFRLSDLGNSGTLYLPADGHYNGGRLYVSLDASLDLKVAADGRAVLDPVSSRTDLPVYDWYEFSYDTTPDPGNPALLSKAFGINNTQVDLFGIPLAMTVTGTGGTQKSSGIAVGPGQAVGSREALIKKYSDFLDTNAYDRRFYQEVRSKDNSTTLRLIAPKDNEPLRNSAYLQNYIDSVWDLYVNKKTQLDICDQVENPTQKGVCLGYRYYTDNTIAMDSAHADQLRVWRTLFDGFEADGKTPKRKAAEGPFYLSKPSTAEVFACNGNIQPGGAANDFGARLCGALNRHVAELHDAADGGQFAWQMPSNFYRQPPANVWAQFWHQIGIGNKAYGFPYDDAADESSYIALPATERLKQLDLTLSW